MAMGASVFAVARHSVMLALCSAMPALYHAVIYSRVQLEADVGVIQIGEHLDGVHRGL